MTLGYQEILIKNFLKSFDTSTHEGDNHLPESKFHKGFQTTEYFPTLKLICLNQYLTDLIISKNPTESVVKAHKQINSIENEKPHIRGKCAFYGTQSFYTREMQYGYIYPDQTGRLYCNQVSIPYLSKQVREYLFKDVYLDFDIVNAHPTILYEYSLTHGIPNQRLAHFINKREEVHNMLHEKSGVPISDLKMLILIIVNQTLEEAKYMQLFNLIWVREFFSEISEIRESLWKDIYQNRSFLSKEILDNEQYLSKTLEKQKVHIQSQYCMTMESRLVLKLYNIIKQQTQLTQNILPGNTLMTFKEHELLSFVPIYDGAFIKVENHHSFYVESLLNKLNSEIKPFMFKQKDITIEGLSFDKRYIDLEILSKYELIQTALCDKEAKFQNLDRIKSLKNFTIYKQFALRKNGKKKKDRVFLEEMYPGIHLYFQNIHKEIREELLPHATSVQNILTYLNNKK